MKKFHAARHTEARGVAVHAICACEPICRGLCVATHEPRHAESYVDVVVSPGIPINCREVPKDCPEVKEGSFQVLISPDQSIQDIDVPDIGDGFRAMIAGPPPASPIEDRGTAIPIEDCDREISERLRLCGVIVKGLPVSLMWRKNDYVEP
ncbi:hypothetical protein F2Q68_00030404 [Brassica cretica]|uniref:Uncharacterized protein n=1 Tax=Brassica cretica TaxID=69181 RepID=A0A8S9GA94_BRACR|nr:hypothetical protein F2Q68_00030404 [Brassica cretica]